MQCSKAQQPNKWLFRVAAVLACLALVSLCALPWAIDMAAKFASSGTGSDSARVAKFNVNAEGLQSKTIAAEIIPGSNVVDGSVVVSVDSEVALRYTLAVVSVTENIPGLTYSLVPAVAAAEASVVSVEAQPGSSQKYNLCINWNPESNADALDYMGMVDYVQITLEAVQID